MNGEEIESAILDCLDRRYPDGPEWQYADYHCLKNEPIELKMIAAFRVLEYNVGNGGWSQVLWNCHGTWSRLLDISREGYLLIGAQEQADAIPLLRALLSENESDCSKFMQRAEEEDDFSYFSKFTSRSYGQSDGPVWEKLFYGESQIRDLRSQWFMANEAHVMAMVASRSQGESWIQRTIQWITRR